MGKLSLMIISCLIKELLLLLLFSIQVNILKLKHHHLLCVEEYFAEHIIFKSTLFKTYNKLCVCVCVC